MANRKRPIQVKFRVTPEERELISKRMKQAGTINMAAYLRKMAIDGYVVKLELPELRERISMLRRYNNNVNQIARRVNSTGRIYDDDIQEIKTQLEKIDDGFKPNISPAVIRRLPRYYRHLEALERKGIVRISSTALGMRTGLTPSQIR